MIARIFRPAFTARRSLLVVGTVLAGLVFPAASMGGADHAAAHRLPPCAPHPGHRLVATCQIKTTPIHKGSKGFDLTVFFKEGALTGYGGRFANSVAGILFKHTGNATENDNYAFSGGIKFTVSKSPLQSATMTGKFAKGRGKMHLTFHATGKPSPAKVPKGCSGQAGTKRTGTLKGSFTLHADNLGTITQKSFKATISTASYQCNKPTHGHDVQTVGFKPAWIDVFKNATGSVSEEFEVALGGTKWTIDHTYTVSKLPSSDYSFNSKTLNKATVHGGGGISGTATYTSPGHSSRHTTGTMSGSLAVTYASIGKITAFPKKRAAKQSNS